MYAYLYSINYNDTWENELMVTFEEPNLFEDPFSATWVKIASTILYLLGLITTSVVWSFFSYQMQGKADPYATVINQLVSCNCFFVRIYHFCFISLVTLYNISFLSRLGFTLPLLWVLTTYG